MFGGQFFAQTPFAATPTFLPGGPATPSGLPGTVTTTSPGP